MRVNIYAEEMSEDVEIISKEIEGQKFTGLRLYLYLPVTLANGAQAQGKFMHHAGDDDSSAVTFWGKKDLRVVLRKMLSELDNYYDPIMEATHYTNAENSQWWKFEEGWGTVSKESLDDIMNAKKLSGNNNSMVVATTDNGSRVCFHAIKFSNGKVWDCINGWRTK